MILLDFLSRHLINALESELIHELPEVQAVAAAKMSEFSQLCANWAQEKLESLKDKPHA